MHSPYRNRIFETGKNRWIIIVNSTLFYIISYLVLYFITQLSGAIAAKTFNINSAIYFYKLDFLASPSEWWFDQVRVVFSVGPFIALTTALVFLIIYLKVYHFDGILKMFFLWGFIHGMALSIGAIATGTFINQGFGNVERWLYMNDSTLLFVGLAGIILLLITGLMISKLSFYSANTYYNMLYPQQHLSFILNQFFLPWIFGIAIVSILKIPYNPSSFIERYAQHDFSILFSGLFIIIPMFSREHSFPEMYFDEGKKTFTIEWKYLILCFALMLVFRFGLSSGMRI
ncbi:MAG: hypothetical protein M0R21_10530 [Lentimicrobiaceae bacterium]|nr:hypothetical protein [Lentimicrobiaceae bacterium]